MKKLILILAVIRSLSSYVSAGDTHYLDFSDDNIIILTMAEGDAARFMFNVREYFTPTIKEGKENIEFREKEAEQVFMLRAVKKSKSGLNLADVTVFISDAPSPYYTSLNKKTKVQLDFDLDSVDDLEIRVLDFNEPNNATFEFIVLDKRNADYKPTKYANKLKKYGLLGITGSSAGIDSIKASFGRLKKIAANNAELSAIAVIALLMLTFNRRHIENALRRIF